MVKDRRIGGIFLHFAVDNPRRDSYDERVDSGNKENLNMKNFVFASFYYYFTDLQ